ncbi:hypothetical protein T492DRAFT_840682 [Pavlovales sp. CCMP2436]|nr:hypothetical protein T492DRAFT_840682 [Pavlovales sp. CCMP2436]
MLMLMPKLMLIRILIGMWRKGAGRVQARPPGPGSAPPAAALAEAGEVDGDSIVWRAGWEGWKPLREAGSELPFVAMAGVASALGAETGDKGAGALRAAEPRPAAGIGGPMGPAAAAAAAARRRFGSSGDEPQTPVE